jgi:hypothetical protein
MSDEARAKALRLKARFTNQPALKHTLLDV